MSIEARLPDGYDGFPRPWRESVVCIGRHVGSLADHFSQSSAASYRPVTTKLAQLSGSQVVSVDYRLCPQHQLPAALLDVFVAYVSLLYPPPQSLHTAVDHKKIMFVGDSSGGVLLLSLLLLIQQTRVSRTLKFHSHTIQLPLPFPAGISLLSPVGELIQAMPSTSRNQVHDLFLEPPWTSPTYPQCSIWPTDPPSPMLYCREVDGLLHPIVCPCIWNSWSDFPPMWFGAGEELFYDGAKAIARKAAQQGVRVEWIEFEAMPHCFFTHPIPSGREQSRLFYQKWAEFCESCTSGASNSRVSAPSAKASWVSFRDALQQPISLEQANDLPLDQVVPMIYNRVAQIRERFQSEWRAFRVGRL